MLEYEGIDVSEGIDANKHIYQRNVIFVTIDILKILVLHLSPIFAMVAMI